MIPAPRPGILGELAVRDLGVIGDLRLLFSSGMTALTGETGAGKTMVVGAIELLIGGRADADLVRPGAAEAVVEGRFDVGGDEVVLARSVPRQGRSRGYVNGRMANAAALSEWGACLVDLHGHQVLVVNHLPQDPARLEQVTVSKEQSDGATVAGVATLGDEGRVVELSRMLSGTPHSTRAREHASELLAVASQARGR